MHPDEYKLARDNAKLVAKKLGITEDEAEGRIVRQLQRNVDGATAQQDAGKRDEPIISILGCGLLKCDAKNTDTNYWNSAYNAEYIKPNQSSYDKGVAQASAGLTPQQIEERNNRAGAPVAKAGAVILGGYALAPTVAAIGTELIAFARNPVFYCTANPTACIGAVDVAAGTAAGVPLTGVPVPHAVPNTGTVGVRGEVGAAGRAVTAEATPVTPLDWSIIGKAGETRAAHINAQHGNLNLQKPSQGVFYGDPVAVTNDAWAIAQTQGIKPITANGVDIYVIPRPNSGYAGGYKGVGDNLNSVTILTEPGTSKIITSYPGNGTPFPKAP